MSRLNLLTRDNPAFPPVNRALDEPNGLLAVGGALDVEWLTAAYRHGIFPWFDEDDGPILWWCPDPRAVIYPGQIRITRSLAKRLRNADFEVTADTAFTRVIAGCAAERKSGGQTATGTWITEDMKRAYTDLHELGLAHSIEVWQAPGAGSVLETETVHTAGEPSAASAGKQLVGGLYGASLGNMFFSETMFSRVADATKIGKSGVFDNEFLDIVARYLDMAGDAVRVTVDVGNRLKPPRFADRVFRQIVRLHMHGFDGLVCSKIGTQVVEQIVLAE